MAKSISAPATEYHFYTFRVTPFLIIYITFYTKALQKTVWDMNVFPVMTKSDILLS